MTDLPDKLDKILQHVLDMDRLGGAGGANKRVAIEAIQVEIIALVPEKLELTKDEENSDWFYGYGWNTCREAMLKALGGSNEG